MNRLITVVGPTAVGKTHLAIQLAKHYNTEIVSADSRQLYREMTIGTAKPANTELVEVKHHFINSHSVEHDYNVYDYAKDAINVIEHIHTKHNLAVLVGGTGLYVDAVCNGLNEIPGADEAVREQLTEMEQQHGLTALTELLKEKDPIGYEKVAKENPQRVMRALEVVLSTGKSLYSYHTTDKAPRPFTTIKIGLNLPRPQLYDRINQRVDEMMQQGFLDEVKSLTQFKKNNALQTVGYKELFSYLDNDITLERAVELIKQNTRRYAKRQLSWFNRDQQITWFQPTDTQNIIAHIDQCLAHS